MRSSTYSSPCNGEVRGGLYLPADNAEKIRKHIRKQINICVMGIILSQIPVSNSPIRRVFSEAVEFFKPTCGRVLCQGWQLGRRLMRGSL